MSAQSWTPPAIPLHSWRATECGGLDLLQGTFTTQVYARHTHETYSIGLLSQGAMTFACRGSTHILHPRLIGLISPDEVHTGHADRQEGWTYRNLYPTAPFIAQVLLNLGVRSQALPRLPVVIDDAPLFAALVCAHRAFEQPASSLARESLLHQALGTLIRQHAGTPVAFPRIGDEAGPLAQVRALLEEDSARNVTLDDLSCLTGLNAFTLLRAFRRAYGLPPHAYQVQARLRQAKRLLRQGDSLAQVALHTGFADQSHFGRHFRRTYGLTPDQYRRGVSRTF